jgi:diguanylate cyclase (GGDEF)-like protein
MEWSFDIRSALLVGALLTTVIGALLMLVARGFPPGYRGAMGWWVAGTLMLPASFVLLAARASLPPWIGIAAANTLIGASLVAYAVALEVFHAQPRRRHRLLALLAVVAVGSLALAEAPDGAPARLAIIVVLIGLIGCLLRNLYAPSGSGGLARHVLGAIAVAAAAILAYRAVLLFLAPAQVSGDFALNLVQVLSYAVASVLPVIASVAFLLMCTERSQIELQRAARVDHLTGSWNRRAIEELGARAIAAARRHGTPLAVLVIDIDHFKRINDDLGHAAGDQALTAAVSRIRDALRAEDVLGRMGGEEFIVVMPNTDAAAATIAGERIRADFSARPLTLDGGPRQVTLSIGVAVLAPADRQFSELLGRADRAMYAAKNAGRDLVIADGMSGWGAG